MRREKRFLFLLAVVLAIVVFVLLIIFYKTITGFLVSDDFLDVSRVFSIESYRIGEGFDVHIQLADSGLESSALGIAENVPEGWEITTASHKGVIKGNKVEWLLVPPKFETLTYSVIPSTENGVFSGIWMTEDLTENRILGNTEIIMETVPKPAVCSNANLLASMNDLIGLTCSGNTCPSATAGRVGGALSFDGADDFVAAPVSITGSEGTFSLWAKFDSTLLANNKGHVVIGIGNSGGDQNYVDLRKLVSNDFVFRYRKSGTDYEVKRTGMVGADTWHYYTAVWTANEIKLYIDGVLIGTTASSSSTGQFGQFRIASRGFQTPALYFKGQIDEVYVWNRALSEAEINELYTKCF